MYFVKGGDQKEYGPVSAEQVRQWVGENRLNQFSLARRDGESTVKPLGQFEEFASLFTNAPLPPGPTPIPVAVPLPTVPTTGPAYDSAKAMRPTQHIGPAIGMIATGALSLLMVLVGGALIATKGIDGLLKENPFLRGGALPPEAMAFAKLGAFAVYGLQAIFAVIIILGGICFLRLKTRGLAFAAAIIMSIPFCGTASILCLLGLPIGIWALVVLSKGEIKDAFE
ncbi:MAG TPA: hypothetical protein VMF06_22315 [Candidatus Limnocylindria bacterium]|jgi:hypothetical protein|nr:hypothetical protein [Candidatus Limnocylindria bacterium]